MLDAQIPEGPIEDTPEAPGTDEPDVDERIAA